MINWNSGSIVVHDGKIYCSVNSKKRCMLPDKSRANTPPFTTKQKMTTFLNRAAYNFGQPVWWDVNHGWLGFVPLSPSYLSLPFEILCWKPHMEGSAQDVSGTWTHKWRIASEDLRAWIRCADQVASAANNIRLAYHIPGTTPPLPYMFGLSDEQGSQRALEHVAEHARKWFSVWMGFLSYLIAQTTQPEYRKHARATTTASMLPAWHVILLEHNFTEAWIDGLKSSTVFALDVHTPRAGVYVDFTQDSLRGDPLWLVSNHVPVWFPYDRFTEEYLQRHNMTIFIPPKHMLAETLKPILAETHFPLAHFVISNYMGVEWTDYKEQSMHFLALKNTTDDVLRICGAALNPADRERLQMDDPATRAQILSDMRNALAETQTKIAQEIAGNESTLQQGMLDTSEYDRQRTTLHADWREFFARQEARELELLATELPAERGAHLQRARSQPTKNTKMFEWTRVKTSGGQVIFTRMLVNKQENVDTWASYHPEERRYYDRRNEWDLFKAFARPTNEPVISEGSEDGFSMGDPPTPGGSEYSFSRPVSPSGAEPNSSPELPRTSSGAEPTGSPQLPRSSVPAFVPAYNVGQMVQSPERDGDVPMLPEFEDLRLSQRTQLQFGFVPPLATSWEKPPDRKWTDTLKATGSHGVAAVTEREEAAMTTFIHSLASKKVPPMDFNDLNNGNHSYLLGRIGVATFRCVGQWYIFHAPTSAACHWRLGFDNAAAVLYLLRLITSELDRRHTMLTLAERLLQRGVGFRTFEKLPKGLQHRLWAPFRPEPSRAEGYRFTGEDFHSSLLQIKSCLMCLPGRAAILEGGIVGRIAREFLGFDEALNGPTAEATYMRNGICVPGPDGVEFWDDGLTEHEKAIICGTYLVYTGKGEQTKKVSWFPSAESWKDSGYDSVEWTPLCEALFQEIYEKARKGTFKPLSHKEWRNELRTSKVARVALLQTRERAAKFLEDNMA